MRTTKIFFRRTRVLNAFALGAFFALVISVPVFGAIAYIRLPAQQTQQQVAPVTATQPESTLADDFRDYRIATYGLLAGQTFYVFTSPNGDRINSGDLMARDVVVKDRGPREALLVRGDQYISLYR